MPRFDRDGPLFLLANVVADTTDSYYLYDYGPYYSENTSDYDNRVGVFRSRSIIEAVGCGFSIAMM